MTSATDQRSEHAVAFEQPLLRFLEDAAPGRAGLIGGAYHSVRAALLASIAQRTGTPIVAVLASANEAQTLVDELKAWVPPDRQVLRFVERDAQPYERLLPDPAIAGRRIECLQSLAAGGAPIIITSSVALSQPTLTPLEVRAHTQRWRPGDRFSIQRVLESWLALGYEPAALVEEPGAFSRRGGVIDIYPVTLDTPVRIELFDDEIETIRRFDAASQRSLDVLPEITVTPAREAFATTGLTAAANLRALSTAHLREDVRARWEEDIDALASQQSFEGIEFYAAYLADRVSLLDHLPANSLIALFDAGEAGIRLEHLIESGEEQQLAAITSGDIPAGLARPYLTWQEVLHPLRWHRVLLLEQFNVQDALPGTIPAVTEVAAALPDLIIDRQLGDFTVSTPPVFGGRFKPLVDQLRVWQEAGAAIAIATPQSARVYELLESLAVPVRHGDSLGSVWPAATITIVQAPAQEGWQYSGPGIQQVLLTDFELFGEHAQPRRTRRAAVDRAFLAELHPGDFVVHVDHGVGRFSKLVSEVHGGALRDYIVLQYQGTSVLKVPTDHLDRVTRYIGSGEGDPQLNSLGGTEWARAKLRAREAARDIAEELIKLYATRASKPGHAFAPDGEWQHQMEAAFPYVETADQLQAIEDVKADMEAPRIMDRLVCGDVGYGKTEVALRAAFKAAVSGMQVALLVPTTVLAEQHLLTFTKRLASFPVRVELMSRFRTPAEQKRVSADLADGAIDIVVGTHRLLQKDVTFKHLGLVIIDEEQRFGVTHKERLKQLRQQVDVLTLSATPIPRTLHMSLAGVRDMTVIDTPPEDRLPVKTYLAQDDDRLIETAIKREFDRDGQVFFVHNRVQTIGAVAERLAKLIPEARIAVGHGQMPPDQLERVMLDFAAGKTNLLVCTTIIESGLDIPNANTIIIHRATHLGLAQLYQLRGRVGRSNRRAYAYLLYGRDQQQLPPLAEKRLRAVFEASELGAGFKIAMKDLEIRGAGNLLGAQQHGHVGAVGFDLYCRMLAEEVDRLKGQAPQPAIQLATVDLPIGAVLPDDYVGDQAVKIDLYRRLAAITTLDELDQLRKELGDRFGQLPEPAANLLLIVELKIRATEKGVTSITANQEELEVRLQPGTLPSRAGLYRAFTTQVRVTPTMVRIPRAAMGRNWLQRIKEVLGMIGV